jgi:hypothetical protein
MSETRSIKRAILRTVFAASILAGLIGIFAFLFGSFNETLARILLTTLAVAYFSVAALACAATVEKKAPPVLTVPAVTAEIAGFAYVLYCIWIWSGTGPDWYFKALAITGILSFTFAQACLLWLAKPKPAFRLFFHGTLVVVFALAAWLSYLVVEGSDSEVNIRIVGVLGILDGCGTVAVLIRRRLDGPPGDEPVIKMTYGEIEMRCPSCGHRATFPVGAYECPVCSLRIHVEIEPPARRTNQPTSARSDGASLP